MRLTAARMFDPGIPLAVVTPDMDTVARAMSTPALATAAVAAGGAATGAAGGSGCGVAPGLAAGISAAGAAAADGPGAVPGAPGGRSGRRSAGRPRDGRPGLSREGAGLARRDAAASAAAS